MRHHVIRAGLFAATMGLLTVAAACHNFNPRRGEDGGGCAAGECPPGAPCGDHAKVCEHPSVHALACDLDHLERHIDWYGSVVPKVPDVWGQARLTQYREEFEQQMSADLTGFQDTLNGSLARSDQAFFAQATTLALAAQPKPPVIGRVTSVRSSDPPALVPLTRDTVTKETNTVVVNDKTTNQTETTTTNKEGVAPTPAAAPPPTPVGLPAVPATKDLLDEKDMIKRNPAGLPTVGFAATKAGGITLEPAVHLAQKARYLDYLNQLRRTNEGSDTADAPGYSLNLMRLPVSVLPGKHTDVGYGAEVTFTLDPVLGDELLPTTFRNLIQNDLRHQLGVPLTQFLNDREAVKTDLSEKARLVVEGMPLFNDLRGWVQKYQDYPDFAAQLAKYLDDLPEGDRERVLAVAGQVDPGLADELKKLIGTSGMSLPRPAATYSAITGAPVPTAVDLRQVAADKAKAAFQVTPAPAATAAGTGAGTPAPVAPEAGSVDKTLQNLADRLNVRLPVPPLSYSPGLINKTGFPTSQLVEVYGLIECFEIAYAANKALEDSITRQGYAHLPDVQAFLQQETFAAQRFLREPECRPLWDQFCTPELVSAVRTRKLDQLQGLRRAYRQMIEGITLSSPEFRKKRPYNEPGQFSVTAALAWCYLVDSALLTDRLIQDMKEAASAKGQGLAGCEVWLPYYLPCPPPEARAAFAAYVKLRWPVYVFALDPVTQEQNITDALSTRREMQLALAVAFTNGMIGVNSLTKYTRRLEADYETIALNRTQVGFAHGENTFGWRFYPRFQSPDTESNLRVLVRDQFVGGPNRNALLRQRRLEPGQRDCVALVIMPSFVPYVTVDSVSNWFALANPKHKVLDHTQAARLSKTVRTLENCEHAITDADCYRDGELRRMQKRVEQLANRLPTQTLTFPVPVLNTLGGFEMFSNGTTDLAPELYGWYGAPGVSATGSTTLFLVGDHFSPLRTRVIVGNQEITIGSPTAEGNRKMLSRQVMQVTVDGSKAVWLTDKKKKYVEAHVATPYGVSRELLIPLIEPKPPAEPAAKEGYSIDPAKLTINYLLVPDGKGKFTLGLKPADAVTPGKLVVKLADASGTGPVRVKLQLVYTFEGTKNKVPCTPQELAYNPAEGGYVLDGGNLAQAAADLLSLINTKGPFDPASVPFDQVKKTVGIEVVPVDGCRSVRTVSAAGSLELEFVGAVSFCPAPATGCLPVMCPTLEMAPPPRPAVAPEKPPAEKPPAVSIRDAPTPQVLPTAGTGLPGNVAPPALHPPTPVPPAGTR